MNCKITDYFRTEGKKGGKKRGRKEWVNRRCREIKKI